MLLWKCVREPHDPILRGIRTNFVQKSKNVGAAKESGSPQALKSIDRSFLICQEYKIMLDRAKTTFHKSQISDCDQSNLFKMVNNMCVAKASNVLPSRDSPQPLADDFVKYFVDKVKSLDSISFLETSAASSRPPCPVEFGGFRALTEDEVRELISRMTSKSCSLDPMPTWMLKLCLDELLPVITRIINNSLCTISR